MHILYIFHWFCLSVVGESFGSMCDGVTLRECGTCMRVQVCVSVCIRVYVSIECILFCVCLFLSCYVFCTISLSIDIIHSRVCVLWSWLCRIHYKDSTKLKIVSDLVGDARRTVTEHAWGKHWLSRHGMHYCHQPPENRCPRKLLSWRGSCCVEKLGWWREGLLNSPNDAKKTETYTSNTGLVCFVAHSESIISELHPSTTSKATNWSPSSVTLGYLPALGRLLLIDVSYGIRKQFGRWYMCHKVWWNALTWRRVLWLICIYNISLYQRSIVSLWC